MEKENPQDQNENENKMTDAELLNYLEHNGIVQELNRTFLHPLGLKIKLNQDSKEVEFWKTGDPKGYLMDRINKMQTAIFQKLCSRKHTERQSKIGFGIQVRDLYRQVNVSKITDLLITPERMKAELIITSLSLFSHLVYEKIIRKHKEKDQNFNPEQFNKDTLKQMLKNNLDKEDWVDVAAIAMMLHQKEKLTDGMKEISFKARNYHSKKQQIEKERKQYKEAQINLKK